MRYIRKRLSGVILLFFIFLSFPLYVFAATCSQDDPCKNMNDVFNKVQCYTDVVNACAQERENMAAQIVYLSSKIELTKATILSTKSKVTQLETEIDLLTQRIDGLENSLTKISGIFLDRIVTTYKYGDVSYLNLLLDTQHFGDLINRYKYLQTVQNHDRKLLFQLQNSKVNFQEQKTLREEKKEELALLKQQLEDEDKKLAAAKREKEVFLNVTKNSEAIYRQNLNAAERESREIQKAASILSSAGVPKKVARGEVIGIMGNSGFSTGPHLHFSVYNLAEADLNKFNFNANHLNPFDFLSSRELTFEANSCSDVGSRQRKSIGNGGWAWPLSEPSITQCYGETPYSHAYYRSGIHSGVDMYDDVSTLVRAADDGNAYTYRGGQAAGNGVFIFHANGKMTLYWHLQ